ncbi:MAG TPA: PP2C family protein-serine/threonine phosphatase [Chitinophagales bacterium]|jgi:sigma-B regulation protein RsbU (phosphoserine phosphatase)|nr:PP2C family protein-serine/threonine phosphatase [Chitinophagales bacterium]MBP6153715.1 PP2C family protein-serine/threonine phosphatase [Chitinophagales bacterium]HQV77863.1 PP2C family protein-serine/threonine phosphatase [Chitinophagales bacterium]HQW78584.1 PP2C family protein-serine/threonine phosphatase [Chitinophagales bacterium]HRB19207.1 PP2C family protein-serine/threonine phosphatase [Chitinophagales bacterium]
MNLPESITDSNALRALVQVKYSQMNALLEATKAINDNVSADSLYQIFKFTLKSQLQVQKLALFMYDQAWKRAVWESDVNDIYIPIQSHFEKFKTITELTEQEQKIFGGFKYVVPVYHKHNPLALALLGNIADDVLHQKKDMLEFTQTFTNIITVAVENKRLFKKEVEKKQYDKELDLASKVQGMLIPKKLPKNTLYEFSGLYLPYNGIGGDYYDVIHINKDEFVFCIGDISGKGIAAALVMANLQAYLNATLGLNFSKEKLIEKLNKKIYSITNGENFITLFIAKYNIVKRELLYLNAGHVPPILLHQNKIELLEKGTTMLGIFEELPKMEFGKINIQPDTTIVSFTDGISELEDEKGLQFGVDRLIEFSKQNHRLSPEIFNKMLYDYISKYKGNVLFNDDISVLTAKFF